MKSKLPTAGPGARAGTSWGRCFYTLCFNAVVIDAGVGKGEAGVVLRQVNSL